MLSECQLRIAYLYSDPTGNAKKLVPNFLEKERNTQFIMKT